MWEWTLLGVLLVAGMGFVALLLRSIGAPKWYTPEIRFMDDECRDWVSFEKVSSSRLQVQVKDGGRYTLRLGATSLRALMQRGVVKLTRHGYSALPEVVVARAGEIASLALLDRATRLLVEVIAPDRLCCTAIWAESSVSELRHDIHVHLSDDEARFQLPVLLQNQGETNGDKGREEREVLFRPGSSPGVVAVPDFFVVRSNYPFRTERQESPGAHTYQRPQAGDLALSTYCTEGDTDNLDVYLMEYDETLEQRRFEHPRLAEVRTRLLDEIRRQNPAAYAFLMHQKTFDQQVVEKGDRILGGS